jgi:hypothetical protein
MKSSAFKSSLVVLLAFFLTVSTSAQSGRPTQNVPVKEAPKKPEPERKETPPVPVEAPDPDAIKLDATLVTVPVVASDRNDLYIPDLKAEEFSLYEDGVKKAHP